MFKSLLLIVIFIGYSLNVMADPQNLPEVDEPGQEQEDEQSQPPGPIEQDIQLQPAPVAPQLESQQLVPGSIAADIADIRAKYNARFGADGKLIKDSKARKRFVKAQDQLAARLRSEGKVGRSIEVHNSYMKDTVIKASILKENGNISGILIERSKYSTKEDAAALRFFDTSSIQQNTVLMNYNNVDVISFKADQFSAEAGGEVAVKYPTNFKNNTFGETKFLISKNAEGEFSFSKDDYEFGRIDLHIFIKIFGGINFGIDDVKFGSAVAEAPATN